MMNTALAFADTPQPLLEPIADRILDAFPSGSYALSALLRLLDIVETTSVPTAAVECRAQPRLLVNPEFVAQHAPTPEKLLVLVMHELHHVLLGHTTLFPRATRVQNFVFDAVINGLVCRMFPSADHTSFFTDYYKADDFPECLLRPPRGWPEAPSVLKRAGLKSVAEDDKPAAAGSLDALPLQFREIVDEVHAALYSSGGATYQEVYDLLPKLLDESVIDGIPLLGGHDQDGAEDGQLGERSPVLFDVVRGIVEQWPQPPDPINGRSRADVLKETDVKPIRPPSARSVLRGLIRKVAGFSGAGAVRRVRMDEVAVTTPIPCLNRRSVVLRAFGCEPMLHTGNALSRRTVRAGERVHVYLDVSGSMNDVRGPLYGAVLDCEEYVQHTVHLFSTKVADISLAELRAGVCKSTGGTNIDCVAQHMADNRVRRALMITDGFVGIPRGQHHKTLDGAKLAVAFLGSNTNQTDLKSVANHTAILSIGA